MISGIGIDIVQIDRIRNAAEKWGEHFLNKVFTGNEILYCNRKKDPYPHLSARFAAKEAFIKAISTNTDSTPNFKDIEVLNQPGGKPFIRLKEDLPDISIHLTMSHEKSHAVATVILERT